jgi:EAL domain-containing protein (putative c-di-GMP-specific phosphodiesterase class I)
MRNLEKKYTPVYTPRFQLSDGSLVGIEIQIKSGQKIISSLDAFKLILSGNGGDLLKQIALHLSKWSEKAEKTLYLSWELSSETTPCDLKLFLDELSLALPLQQLEIVLDADNLKGSDALSKCRQLFAHFTDNGIRRGLLHSRPLELNPDELCACIDMLKLKRGVIFEMKENIALASQGYALIESLNANNIAIVADELYSKADVTSAVLMGIRYGQGYFLSRNQAPQKIVKTLKKTPNHDFYERHFDCFENLVWY